MPTSTWNSDCEGAERLDHSERRDETQDLVTKLATGLLRRLVQGLLDLGQVPERLITRAEQVGCEAQALQRRPQAGHWATSSPKEMSRALLESPWPGDAVRPTTRGRMAKSSSLIWKDQVKLILHPTGLTNMVLSLLTNTQGFIDIYKMLRLTSFE